MGFLPPTDRSLKRPRETLIHWFQSHRRDLPWRPEDLRMRRDPYAVWISETMLQQTQVISVIPRFLEWMRILPTLKHLAQAEDSVVLRLWQGLGYYSRARSLHRAAKTLADMGLTTLPPDARILQSLPGIGAYTAGAILSLAFHQQAPILDGNMIRIFSRLHEWKYLPSHSAQWKKIYWQEAVSWIHDAPAYLINEALMELGALICTPRTPQCPLCPLQSECLAFRNQRTDIFPPRANKPRTAETPGKIFWFYDQDSVLLEKSPSGLLARQWRLPILIEPITKENAWLCSLETSVLAQPGVVVRHSITRYRLKLQLHTAKLTQTPQAPVELLWVPVAQLTRIVANSLALKVLQKIQASGLNQTD